MSSDSVSKPSPGPSWIKRLYVPLVTLALVLVIGQYLINAAVNAKTIAQNKRMTFQEHGDAGASKLPAADVAVADRVVDFNHAVDPHELQVLVVSNSQTLAIMDRLSGDLLSAQWLAVELNRAAPRAIDVRLGSLPNITADESLVQLVSAAESSPRKVDVFLAGEVLEEFRGLGLRASIEEIARRPDVTAALQKLSQENADLPAATKALEPIFDTKKTGAAQNKTGSEKFEDLVNDRLDAIPVFAKRQDIQVQVQGFVWTWRNRLLHITSSSIRPVPAPAFDATMQLLELQMRYTRDHHVKMVVFMTPIRPVIPNPNLPADVEKYRKAVPALCAKYGVRCLDYIDLVPEEMWTNYADSNFGDGGQRDYAHFTGKAHKLVGEKLFTDLGPDLLSAAKDRSTSP